MLRHILRPIAILRVIYLRKRYKKLTLDWEYEQTNQHLAVLRLIQSKICYYHDQFNAWGYFHPSCVVKPSQTKFMAWLFPPKDYDELELLASEGLLYSTNRFMPRLF